MESSTSGQRGGGRKSRWLAIPAAGAIVIGGVAISTFADASPAARMDPVTVKPDATQVEPEVLAAVGAAEAKAAAQGKPLDEKTATIVENLGSPDTTPGGSVAGVVADAKGAPMSGAGVVLMDTDGNLMAETVTDGAGKYRVTSLQSGPYVLQVLPSAKDSAKWARTWYPADPSFLRANVLTVTDVGTTANVSVQPGAAVDMSVTGQGKPVAGATVQVCGESYLDCQTAKSDSKGKVAFAGLPGTALRVAVTTTDGSRYEFASLASSAGANKITLDTANGKLVAKGKS